MADANVAFEDVGPLLVVVHTDKDPSDVEWGRFVDWLEPRVVGSQRAVKMLVVTGGASLSTTQRQMLIDRVLSRATVTIGVLTDSTIVRGVVTVFNWFIPHKVRAFPLGDLSPAMKFLGLTRVEGEAAERLVDRLARGLGSHSLMRVTRSSAAL